MIEDAVDHLGLSDEGNDAHGLPAAGHSRGYTLPELYKPALEELATFGYRFKRRTVPA